MEQTDRRTDGLTDTRTLIYAYRYGCGIVRAAVGMGIPMGIPIGMGWV